MCRSSDRAGQDAPINKKQEGTCPDDFSTPWWSQDQHRAFPTASLDDITRRQRAEPRAMSVLAHQVLPTL